MSLSVNRVASFVIHRITVSVAHRIRVLTGRDGFTDPGTSLVLTGESFDRTGPSFEADQEVLSKLYDQSTLGRQD